MNLPDAHVAILRAFGQMKAIYGQPVFNEWILVKIARESGAILAYDGPRADQYQSQFKKDVARLQAEMDTRKMTVGDFEFVNEAHGTQHDACVRLGPAAYLFCNHTTKSMHDIRRDPKWLEAQKPFVEFAASFRSDPLV
jgi:hypothetical protein